LLRAIERSSHCLSIADAGRVLSTSRQAVHKAVHAALRAGHVDLMPNFSDRRILQLALTPLGRAVRNRVRAAQREGLAVLLSRVETRELTAASRLPREVRQQLLQAEREREAERRRRPR
jgi:DNA-binding MarR family transcriptional regulator